jgi:hypothetical protein
MLVRHYWLMLPEQLRRALEDSTRAGDTIVAFVDLTGARVPAARSRDTTMWAFVLRDVDGPGRTWFAALCGKAP